MADHGAIFTVYIMEVTQINAAYAYSRNTVLQYPNRAILIVGTRLTYWLNNYNHLVWTFVLI